MREGVLFRDRESGRYDIVFYDGDPERSAYYGGLHCGDCFKVFHGGEWIETRIESSAAKYEDWRRWYLAGLDDEMLIDGLRVRM